MLAPDIILIYLKSQSFVVGLGAYKSPPPFFKRTPLVLLLFWHRCTGGDSPPDTIDQTGLITRNAYSFDQLLFEALWNYSFQQQFWLELLLFKSQLNNGGVREA